MAVFQQLRILSPEDVLRIHEASLGVLARTGVRVPHERVRELFAEAGAGVDAAPAIVRIPAELVDRCLASSGKRFALAGRDRGKLAELGAGKRNYNTIFGQAMWLDHRTGQRRFPSLDDVAVAARVGDALPHITIVGAMADPHEIPVSFRCVEVAATLARNTTKPIGLWFHDRRSAVYLVEILQAVAGTRQELELRPPTFPLLEPISPLSFAFNSLDLLFETCRVPLPVPIGPMAQVGATAPGTLAGTLVQENAEILAGLCVTQLIRPGTPVCYGGIPHAFDMRTTQLVFAGPEQGLMAVAMVQMARHYGLPVYVNVGLTDSKIPDAQAGLEAGMTLFAGALAGADIFGHLGISGVDQAASLPMLLMQHEIVAYVERLMKGFAVNDETIARDVIGEVGPGGNFLAHDHTVAHFRDELWFPALLDRSYFAQWEQGGRLSMADRIEDRLEALLARPAAELPPPELERELARITASARHHLGGERQAAPQR